MPPHLGYIIYPIRLNAWSCLKGQSNPDLLFDKFPFNKIPEIIIIYFDNPPMVGVVKFGHAEAIRVRRSSGQLWSHRPYRRPVGSLSLGWYRLQRRLLHGIEFSQILFQTHLYLRFQDRYNFGRNKSGKFFS